MTVASKRGGWPRWPWAQVALLKRAVAAYAGPHVLSAMLREGGAALDARAEECEATLLYTDIAGFAAFPATLGPVELLNIMGRHLDLVLGEIDAHGGVVADFVGDAVFAWWKTPDPRDGARSACDCARAIIAGMETGREARYGQLAGAIRLQAGINSGKVILGNIGGPRRLRYSAMGAHVNLASRLCALAATEYPDQVLVSGFTTDLLPPGYGARVVDRVRVKGQFEPVVLHTI